MTKIEERIIQIIADVMGSSYLTIEPDDDLRERWGFDSLDIAELTVLLDDDFDIDFEETPQSELKTVADIARKVKELQG